MTRNLYVFFSLYYLRLCLRNSCNCYLFIQSTHNTNQEMTHRDDDDDVGEAATKLQKYK